MKNMFLLITSATGREREREQKNNIIKHKSYETRIEKLNYVYYEKKQAQKHRKLNWFR